MSEHPPRVAGFALVIADGKEYSIPPGRVTVGREADCDLVIADPLVSRRHADLYVRDGTLYIEDLGSANGTLLNGAPMEGERSLSGGDVIEFGDTRVIVRVKVRPISISLRSIPPVEAMSEAVPELAAQQPSESDVTSVIIPAVPPPSSAKQKAADEAIPNPIRESAAIMPEPPVVAPPYSDSIATPLISAPDGDGRLAIQASAPRAVPGGLAAEITLRGVLDIETADQFREATSALVQAQVIFFTIALDEVEYIDSSGLGALVGLHREVKPRSGSVELQRPQPAVQSVIELTRLNRVFKIV